MCVFLEGMGPVFSTSLSTVRSFDDLMVRPCPRTNLEIVTWAWSETIEDAAIATEMSLFVSSTNGPRKGNHLLWELYQHTE